MRLLGIAAFAGIGVLTYRALKKRQAQGLEAELRPEAINAAEPPRGRAQAPADEWISQLSANKC